MKAYEKELALLEKKENFDKETRINSLCATLNFVHEVDGKFSEKENMLAEEVQHFLPKITYFMNINLTNMPTIDKIINLKRSYCVIFDSYFSDACDKVKELHASKNKELKDLNIQLVINDVWPLALRNWKQITVIIQNGQIKLLELDEMLRIYFQGNYHKMQEELIYMNNYFEIQNLNLRNEQIK